MKDENSQVSETFDEQEQFRPEKRGLRLFFCRMGLCFYQLCLYPDSRFDQ